MRTAICILSLLLLVGCQHARIPETISIWENWRFAPDEAGNGLAAGWHAPQLDDAAWDSIDAGLRWEDQGYKELDGFGWYRKQVEIPAHWQGQRVWIKFGGTNDAYTLFVNGNEVSAFGAANISFAGKPSISEITEYVDFGAPNLIAVQVNDWGGSGGLWHLPVEITTDEDAANNLFKPMSDIPVTPEELGYALFWEDNFDGNALDDSKWAVRGEGPRAIGYLSSEAVAVEDGFLKITAFEKNGTILTGAVGTQGRFETTYGYFECRAQLQKSPGNWAAFWIQSPGIAKGEDPGKYGVEIDIFEYFKKSGEDIVSHNLHWAYGP
ncbi:MAG TPA: family 16 glycosylhydrolase, partial [Candidatus Hydrogenedentes bacterium]|nr:family 16 glycosylhydrolase [Candidatus Hydrogenedentota bacterium]